MRFAIVPAMFSVAWLAACSGSSEPVSPDSGAARSRVEPRRGGRNFRPDGDVGSREPGAGGRRRERRRDARQRRRP